MKKIIIYALMLISFSTFAQNGGGGFGGGVPPRPIDDTRTLLEVLRNRNNEPRLTSTIPNDLYNGGVRTGGSGGTIGPKPVDDSRTSTNDGGGFSGGNVGPKPSTNSTTNSDLGALAGQVTQDQIRAFKTEVDAFNARTANKGDEEVLPTRLHIESINLSSDEVTEITLKDGSVVKIEDLQEFVRQKMKEKLNQ